MRTGGRCESVSQMVQIVFCKLDKGIVALDLFLSLMKCSIARWITAHKPLKCGHKVVCTCVSNLFRNLIHPFICRCQQAAGLSCAKAIEILIETLAGAIFEQATEIGAIAVKQRA